MYACSSVMCESCDMHFAGQMRKIKPISSEIESVNADPSNKLQVCACSLAGGHQVIQH